MKFVPSMPEQKHTSSFLHTVGAIGVFLFTASCTVDLFKKITPESTPWLPWLAVAILEYGLFSWGYAYLHKYDKVNHSRKNRIALAMACFSGLCVAAVTTVELAYVVQVKGMAEVPTELLSYAIWLPVLAVGLNVLAYLGCVIWANEDASPQSLVAPPQPQQYYMIRPETQQYAMLYNGQVGGYQAIAPFSHPHLLNQPQMQNVNLQTLNHQGMAQQGGTVNKQESNVQKEGKGES